MKLNNYGFIVKAPGYHPEEQRAVIENGLFRTEVVGVNTIEQAIQVAEELIDNGIQLIELCGGVGEEDAKQVIDTLDVETPIGFVDFSATENSKLSKFLSD